MVLNVPGKFLNNFNTTFFMFFFFCRNYYIRIKRTIANLMLQTYFLFILSLIYYYYSLKQFNRHGTCNLGKCYCDAGWINTIKGEECSQKVTCKNDCSGHGKYSKAKKSECNRVYESTVVDISIPPSSFKPVSLFFCHVSPFILKTTQNKSFF